MTKKKIQNYHIVIIAIIVGFALLWGFSKENEVIRIISVLLIASGLIYLLSKMLIKRRK